MKKILFIIFLFICTISKAQNDKLHLGVEVGNHLSFTYFDGNGNINGNLLLRYSAGVLARYKFKTGFKIPRSSITFIPVRDGIWSLDVGVNAVFTGYDYNYDLIGTYQDQLAFEFPILFTFWDNRSVLLSRKWRRKKLNWHSRIGIKPSILLENQYDRSVSNDVARIDETVQFGGFNLAVSYGNGIMKTLKNGNMMMLELQFNIGILRTTFGQITYRDLINNTTQQNEIIGKGHYVALKVLYLFKTNFVKTYPAPIIHSPRF